MKTWPPSSSTASIRKRSRSRTQQQPGQQPREGEARVLDRVLHGEVAEAFVAAEGGGEPEKGQVVARVSLVAVVESR